MIRSAAKNHAYVAIVTDPEDYPALLEARYKLQADALDAVGVIETIAKKRGCLLKGRGGEFDLLAVMCRHPGRVLSRDFLLEATRGREAAPFDRTIDVQVGRLRKKIEADPENPQIIKSVRGAGYIFVPPVGTAAG